MLVSRMQKRAFTLVAMAILLPPPVLAFQAISPIRPRVHHASFAKTGLLLKAGNSAPNADGHNGIREEVAALKVAGGEEQHGLPWLSDRIDRRSALVSTPLSVALALFGASETQASSSKGPIIVIGAGGG